MPGNRSRAAVHILYAEDDPPSGRLVQSIAESEGYSITVVSTGRDFLAALNDEKPELVLLDLNLMGRTGLDVMRTICPLAPQIALDFDHVVLVDPPPFPHLAALAAPDSAARRRAGAVVSADSTYRGRSSSQASVA